jgi:hypothetical protein
MIYDGQFLRRKYADSTQDSICLTCFLIAGEGSEADVEYGEANHNCEQAILADCLRPQLQCTGSLSLHQSR